ncbi:MAG: hypothetical protein EHM23_29415 [Acidobacteria bacterium]|nr:MAG: hypothetical protein EHM23_29415 [Acidobacteriota bacterium]
MQRKNSRLTIMLLAALLLGPCASLRAAAELASSLVGDWQGATGQAGYTLLLNADGRGSLNGAPIQWRYSGGSLHLKAAKGSFDYRAAFTATTLTLTGNDLQQPLIFKRVEPAAAVAAASRPDKFPIPGNPPLTAEMVEKGVRLFEWLLDARLTEEQYKQFQDSLVRSWKTANSAEMSGTLGVLQFHAELGRKTELERNAMREALLDSYLALMRETPTDVLSAWVLEIYYSSHTPIAQGNPPLTRQVADAYAEVNCFMISEVLGGEAFRADKAFKDQLATALVAEYSNFSPEQQKGYSRLPLAWASIRMTWSGLGESERATYRQQWSPGVQAMLAPQGSGEGAAPTVRQGPSDAKRAALQKFRTQTQIRQMLSNMNQDFIHRHVLSPGWTYTKYSIW